MSVFVAASTVLAGALLVYRLIRWKNFFNNKILWVLVAFLVSYGISMAINMQYGLVTQIKTAAWMGMQYLLLFATDNRKTVDDLKKEFKIVSIVYLIYMAVASLTSMVFLFTNYSNIKEIPTESGSMRVISGFTWGRLWGVFTDPNYGSVMSVVAIILSLYFIFTNKKVFLRIVLALNIVLQTLYFAFSDSRTGIVAIFLSVGVMIFCLAFRKPMKMNTFVKSAACIVLACAVMGTYLFAVNEIKDGYNAIVTKWEENEPPQQGSEEEDNRPSLVGREQDLENDISNRRFDLWESSLDLIKARPIFGVSFNNVKQFTEEHFPENYLVNNDHGKYDNYHNMLFNIIVGQGIVGFALFIGVAAWAGIKSIARLKEKLETPDAIFYVSVFAILLTTLSCSMFTSDLVYVNSPNSTMFWYLLGVMLFKNANEVKKVA